MFYLLFQMLFYMIVMLLLGVLLGWILWHRGYAYSLFGGEQAATANATGDDAALRTELNDLREKNVRLTTELSDSNAERNKLQNELDGCLASRAALESRVDGASAARPAAAMASVVAAAVGTQPEGLSGPRGGAPDDLKTIKGIGEKLEEMLHGMGIYHFDQIAGWGDAELAWVDENLEGFKGRASRDEWISQARKLA